MLDKLFHLLPKHSALMMIKDVLGHLEELLRYFEQEYHKDPDVKDAAIDALIDLLTSLKNNATAQIDHQN